jgi:hypothetical protein
MSLPSVPRWYIDEAIRQTLGNMSRCDARVRGTVPERREALAQALEQEAQALRTVVRKKPRPREDVSKLRQEAAAVHPDRGGTNEQFIAAHKKYRLAKERANFIRKYGWRY